MGVHRLHAGKCDHPRAREYSGWVFAPTTVLGVAADSMASRSWWLRGACPAEPGLHALSSQGRRISAASAPRSPTSRPRRQLQLLLRAVGRLRRLSVCCAGAGVRGLPVWKAVGGVGADCRCDASTSAGLLCLATPRACAWLPVLLLPMLGSSMCTAAADATAESA